MSISILILTLNEEINLPACLESVKWCDDIVVLDSFSTDKTVDIANTFGTRVFQRKFDNFACQRNYAIDNIKFKHEWLFHLDADEIFTEELKEEMRLKISSEKYDAYRVPSKMMFCGKWLKFSATYPTYQVRIGRYPLFHFKQVGHGQREDLDINRIGTLQNPYIHYSFNKGFSDWFQKHNIYSSLEAKEIVKFIDSGRIKITWRNFLFLIHIKGDICLKSYLFLCLLDL